MNLNYRSCHTSIPTKKRKGDHNNKQLSLLQLPSPASSHCAFLFGLLQLVYLHCAIWHPSANAILLPRHRLQTSYPPSAQSVSSASVPFPPPHTPGCFSMPPASSPPPPLTPSEFFNGMLEVFMPGGLNYYTLSLLTLLILTVSKNLTLTHFLLSGSLNYLPCDLIAPTPGLAFFPRMTRTLAAASSYFCQTGPILLRAFYLLSLFA